MMGERAIDGLPPSFHQSFMPERHHLSALLALAINSYEGGVEDISETTGIPTGKSSGKVVPHIRYAQAMGLICSSMAGGGGYRLELTPLGRTILTEDPALHEVVTQLILHLMLTRPVGGASVWHVLFGMSSVSLGQRFSAESATACITSVLGKNSSIPGPVFSTYREESSLARTGQLIVEQSRNLQRGRLPTNPDYFWGFAYCWLSYWESVAPGDQQLAFALLEAKTGFHEVTGWTREQYDGFLSWVVDNRIARVDRQTGEPLILRTASSQDIVGQIYSELI